MKIVQSYWSLPTDKNKNINAFDRNKGGWIDKKYNYMSWTLSCLQFCKFYNNVELITDQKGYDLLIHKLGLPYTKVKVELDRLNEYDPDLWALGKIYAYSVQDEPFIHADGDVFIFDKFKDDFENSAIIAQSKELGLDFYMNIFNEIIEHFDYIPEILINSISKNKEIIATNTGIFGGQDIKFIKSYAEEIFKFIDNNKENHNKITLGMFNVIFEQFILYAKAENENIKIKYLFENINQHDGLAEFFGAPKKIKYIHTLAYYKTVKYIGDLLEYRLLTDYPDYYFKILNLIRTNQI